MRQGRNATDREAGQPPHGISVGTSDGSFREGRHFGLAHAIGPRGNNHDSGISLGENDALGDLSDGRAESIRRLLGRPGPGRHVDDLDLETGCQESFLNPLGIAMHAGHDTGHDSRDSYGTKDHRQVRVTVPPRPLKHKTFKKPNPEGSRKKRRGIKYWWGRRKKRGHGPTKSPPDETIFTGSDPWPPDLPKTFDAIVWEQDNATGPGTPLAYLNWTQAQQDELRAAYLRALEGKPSGLVDPPPNKATPLDEDGPTTVLDKVHAWPLFINYVAWSLALEMSGKTSWSLENYEAEELALLFDSRHMFIWDVAEGGYRFEKIKGRVVPAPPDYVLSFLETNATFDSRIGTIAGVLEWCRANMWHFYYSATTSNMEKHWQYRGFTPVSRVIEGTLSAVSPNDGVQSWTAGCHGTLGFLRSVLRVANIPVMWVRVCGHSQVHFIAEGMYLAHGDDPYSGFAKDPAISAEEMMIDSSTYTAWFVSSSDEDACKNVSGRTGELAVKYLPVALLEVYCNDLKTGVPHANGRVVKNLPSYTLQQLEDVEHLWDRMDSKLASIGGCSALP